MDPPFFVGEGGGGASLPLVLVVLAWLLQLFCFVQVNLGFLDFLLGFLYSRLRCLLVVRSGLR